ncbi:MAG: SGNH/GDSL hydrolase family protein [Bacteroidota bacterium]
MNWETYAAFGDSITIGARTYLGYPELTAHELTQALPTQWNVINHAVCGYKAIDLARHIDTHFADLKEIRPSIATILIGTNDIKEGTSLSNYLIAMEQVVLKVRLLTMNNNVLLLAIPELHRGVSYPYSVQMNETVAGYNTELKKLARRNNIRMMELDHSADDFVDGVHLSETGVETFSEQIVRYVLTDKGLLLPAAGECRNVAA